MKLILGKTDKPAPYHVAEMLRHYLAIHRVYIRQEDIECSYNSVYHFYDVSVFKCNRDVIGNGTKTRRAQSWEKYVSIMKTIEPFASAKSWKDWRCGSEQRFKGSPVDVDEDPVPGIRFFIDCADPVDKT